MAPLRADPRPRYVHAYIRSADERVAPFKNRTAVFKVLLFASIAGMAATAAKSLGLF